MLEYHPNRPFPDLRGVSRCLVHHSILSRNGVSGKPGAVQRLIAHAAIESNVLIRFHSELGTIPLLVKRPNLTVLKHPNLVYPKSNKMAAVN
jgi:hypothetical protein